jgi:hypothetical protein
MFRNGCEPLEGGPYSRRQEDEIPDHVRESLEFLFVVATPLSLRI